jgi:hypothetical protein
VTSVSQLVERYLNLLSRPFDIGKAPPVLRMLRFAAPPGTSRLMRSVRSSRVSIGKLLLLDLNVILGVILDRAPGADAAAAPHRPRQIG